TDEESGMGKASLSGNRPLDEGGENADDQLDPGKDIGHRDTRTLRLPLRYAGQVHDPAYPLRHEIVAGPRRIGTALTETGDRAIDQPRHVFAQTRVVQPELCKPAYLEILDQHIGSRGKLPDHPPPLVALEVELDGALAAVGGVEIGRPETAAIGCLHEWRAPATGIITGPLAFHFDDVGTEVRKNLTRPRPGQDPGKLQDAQSGQRSRHSTFLSPAKSPEWLRPEPCVAFRANVVHILSPGTGSRARGADQAPL